jgi:integrase
MALQKFKRHTAKCCKDKGVKRDDRSFTKCRCPWQIIEPPPSAAPVSAAPSGLTVDRAINVFLSEQSEALAANTLRKYRFMLSKLKGHSDAKGYVLLEQWTPMDVREFRGEWQVSVFTASKNMAAVKSFFEFCLVNEWIGRNPARLVKNLRGQADPKKRIPFSDAELKRMFDACETQYGKRTIRWSRDVHHHAAEGQTAYRAKNFRRLHVSRGPAA